MENFKINDEVVFFYKKENQEKKGTIVKFFKGTDNKDYAKIKTENNTITKQLNSLKHGTI